MQPADGTEPGPGRACRACGKQLPEGGLVCPACGAAHGEANRCPHCQAVADVEPHAVLGFRCRVCGGPRVPIDVADAVLGPATRAALHSAGREHTKHVVFSAAGLALSGMGVLGLLVAVVVLVAATPGVVPMLATFLGSSVPLLAGLLVLARASAARKERAAALHGAQLGALADIQSVTGPLDAERVARDLRIDVERAELLLAEASVSSLLADAAAPRVRVEAAPALSAPDAELAAAPNEPTQPQRRDTES